MNYSEGSAAFHAISLVLPAAEADSPTSPLQGGSLTGADLPKDPRARQILATHSITRAIGENRGSGDVHVAPLTEFEFGSIRHERVALVVHNFKRVVASSEVLTLGPEESRQVVLTVPIE